MFCNTSTNACVDCLNDGHCSKGPGDTGACGSDGECGFCTTDQECVDATGTPYCNTAMNKCVWCLTDDHCTKGTGNTGICNVALGGCDGCDSVADCTEAFPPEITFECK